MDPSPVRESPDGRSDPWPDRSLSLSGDPDREHRGALHARLAVIAARLRERALDTGTFNAELACDLEQLADITATLQTITTRVEALVAELETALT